MEVRITKGRPEDHMDIVDFINMVFREDFLVTESKLYLDRPEMAEKHHLVLEDDRIKAVVGNFPISLNVAGNHCTKNKCKKKKKRELLLEHINMYVYVSYVLNVFLKNFTQKISFNLIKSYAIFN